MRQILFHIFFLFLVSHAVAQQNSVSKIWNDRKERADDLYAARLYDAALQLYMESYLSMNLDSDSIARDQQELMLSIADSYYKLRKLDWSVKFYKDAFSVYEDSIPSFHLLQYGESLLFTENIDESKRLFSKYYLKTNDPLGKERFNGTIIYDDLMASVKPTTISNLSVNNTYSMISPVYKDGALYFSGPDSSRSLVNRDYLKGDMELYKIYVTDSSGTRRVKTGKKLTNLSSAVFLPNDKVMFTANSRSESALSIYEADIKSADQWVNVKSIETLKFDSASVHSIAINSNYDALYISLLQEGGFGGYDLYEAVLTDDGWSIPNNMGPFINTSANEISPFLKNERLYFASNGHPGLGGYDLFEYALGEVSNMASPINSSQDDFDIFFKDDSNGYLISNRKGGKGKDDIYAFVQTEKPEIDFDLILTRKLNGEIMDSVMVTFKGLNRTHAVSGVTDINGELNIPLKTRTKYAVTIEKENFITLTDTISTLLEPISVAYQLDENLTFQALVFESTNESAIPNPTIFVEDLMDKSSFEVQGNQVGFFQIEQPSFKQVSLLITKEGYGFVSDTIEFNRPESNKTYTLKKVKPAGTLTLKDLLYELDQYQLKDDYVPVLDSIASSLSKFDNLRIIIESHTDSRGDKDYNLILSQKRSESVKAYLVAKGVSPDRIGAIGRGEEQLLNQCGDGVSCSDEEHQVNRRTEIKLFRSSG